MSKAIGLYFAIVELVTLVGITIFYFFKLPFSKGDVVFAGYLDAIVKNHISSLQGTLDIFSLWISSISTKHIPIAETLMYFWNYKITWVGVGVLIIFFLINYNKYR
jgi:hypothetical protein